MSEIDDTAAWQRLVAADPAGSDPDLAALGDRIIAAARASSEQTGDADVASGASDSAVGIKSVARPLPQRMFALAAGVAVLAGVGIGGYALGARTSSTDIVASDAPVSAELSAGGAPTSGARTVPTDVAATDAGVAAADAAPFTVTEDGSTTALTPTPVPQAKVPQTLSGFTLSDIGIDRAALAAQLARVLGVKGKPLALPSGDWIVGPTEGTNAVLVIGSSAAVPWSMTNPAPPVPAGTEISESRANEVARALFAQIGVPVDDVEWEAVSVGGLITETAWYVTDGERTPLFWRIAFDTSGEIVSATGFAGNVIPQD